MMIVTRSCCVLLGMLMATSSARLVAAAESDVADDSFGRGVHAYFAGESAKAESLFLQSMGNKPNDPRPYYFHALCLLHQGRSDEARSDVIVGAALEAQSRGSYAVGKSLERVQGGDRLLLEQYRWQSRTDRVAATGDAAKSYAVHRAALAMQTDAGVLRQKVSVPLDRLVRPVSFDELANVPTTTAPVKNSAAATAADPFADDPRAATEGKIPSSKLFGILGRAIVNSAPVPSLDKLREQLPALPAPAANNPAPAADNIFGSDPASAPAADEAFSQPAPADDGAKGSDPPADAAAEEDPFGGF